MGCGLKVFLDFDRNCGSCRFIVIFEVVHEEGTLEDIAIGVARLAGFIQHLQIGLPLFFGRLILVLQEAIVSEDLHITHVDGLLVVDFGFPNIAHFLVSFGEDLIKHWVDLADIVALVWEHLLDGVDGLLRVGLKIGVAVNQPAQIDPSGQVTAFLNGPEGHFVPFRDVDQP